MSLSTDRKNLINNSTESVYCRNARGRYRLTTGRMGSPCRAMPLALLPLWNSRGITADNQQPFQKMWERLGKEVSTPTAPLSRTESTGYILDRKSTRLN